MEATTNTKNISIPEAFRSSASDSASTTAVVFQDRKLTFAELDALSDRVAAGLAERGVKKGDHIALYCINSDAFVLAYFGILKAGATVIPINLLLNPKEVAYILKDSQAEFIIYFEAFTPVIEALNEMVPGLEVGICIGENPADPTDQKFTELLATTSATPEIEFDAQDDVAVILYTSGTTGFPKGAMLTHHNLVSNTKSINQALPIKSGIDSVLVVLPMFHAFAATAGMLYPLLHGCTVVPLPKFEPHSVAEAIETHKIAMFMAVPSMYSVLLHLPKEAASKFSSLKYCISGGAAMPAAVLQAFEERFGKAIYEGDGPTECSPVTCVNPVEGERKLGSVGLAVPQVEMKIMDDEGKEKPLGEIGEICVRGPNVMKGYWNLPEETAESFFGEWFRTGDLGTEDEEGYFFIVDRKKDMLIVNGMNVYPRIVEEILYHHDAIAEAAVIGEPHDLHGEIPVAYVALTSEGEANAAEIRAFCRESLGRHEVPRKVYFMDELPKNAAGKIVKRALRQDGELERGIDLPSAVT